MVCCGTRVRIGGGEGMKRGKTVLRAKVRGEGGWVGKRTK